MRSTLPRRAPSTQERAGSGVEGRAAQSREMLRKKRDCLFSPELISLSDYSPGEQGGLPALILWAASHRLVLAGILQVSNCSLLLRLRGAFVISTASFGLLQHLKKKKRGEDSGSLCLSKAALFPWAGMAHGQRAALHARLVSRPDARTARCQPASKKGWVPPSCEGDLQSSQWRAPSDG